MSSRGAETPQQALARARRHARSAAAEGVSALGALLDAAALASAGRPAHAHPDLAPLARWLDDAADLLEPRGAPAAAALLGEISRALDTEITRWRRRAARDPDARAVLETLRSVREILDELGSHARPRSRRATRGSAQPRRGTTRRRRVKVE